MKDEPRTDKHTIRFTRNTKLNMRLEDAVNTLQVDKIGNEEVQRSLEPTPASVSDVLKTNNKGQRCTMQEFRSAIMKKKKTTLRYEIDLVEMSEDNCIEADEFVSIFKVSVNSF